MPRPRPLSLTALALPGLLAAQAPDRQPPAHAPSSVTHINVDSVDLAGVTTLGELLQARAPGLLAQATSGQPGAGTHLTLRGRRSAVLHADEPLLVVDGVRVVGGQRTTLLDSTFATSRYDDLPVEEIAAVDVLPGAAAAARYGPGAAAGAIVVTTRRARPAHPERRAYAEAGAAAGLGGGPAFYRGAGQFHDDVTGSRGCTIDWQAGGGCTLTGVQTVHPYAAAGGRTGARVRLGGRIAGGGERARYSVGAHGARLDGPVEGSSLAQGVVRAGADLRPRDALRVRLGTTLLTRTTDAPFGALTNRVQLAVNANSQFLAPAATRADAALTTTRVDAAAGVEWAARPWLDARATVSTSVARQRERSAREQPGLASYPDVRTTETGSGRSRERVTVAEVGAAARYRLGGAGMTTALTAQRVDDRLTAGAEVVQQYHNGDLGGSSGFSFQGTPSADVRGLVAEHRVAAGRLQAGGTVRLDRVGVDHARATTGAADAAFRLWGNEARGLDVRAAYGSSVGRSLAEYPLLQVVAAPPTNVGGGIVVGGATGYELVPLPRFERTREVELGLDARLGPALAAGVTVYDQRTRDVLAAAEVYNPTGPSGSYLVPIGLANRGVEASVRARLVERSGLGATLGVRAWGGRNRARDLPGVQFAAGYPFGLATVTRNGAPLGAYTGAAGNPRARDLNGDGLVTSFEAGQALVEARNADPLAPAPVIGSPVPTRTAAVDLQARVGTRLTLAALAEYQGGRRGVGDGAWLFEAARGSVDPAAGLDAQARAASARAIPGAGLERADFVRLREVSAGWRLRGGRAGGAGTTVTLAGRNLLTGTRYSGLDPEAGAEAGIGALYAVPVPRTLAVRVAAGW